ncbi:MAG: hypothetical protein Kow0074_04800 [Candidatus Zixiibacteriota bacterium]
MHCGRFAARWLRPESAAVAERKPFLLRVDPNVLDAVQKWANDELRSLNGQIEFLLRRALKEAGREKNNKQSVKRGRGRG